MNGARAGGCKPGLYEHCRASSYESVEYVVQCHVLWALWSSCTCCPDLFIPWIAPQAAGHNTYIRGADGKGFKERAVRKS